MIFGNQAPQFEVSGVKVLLDFTVIERDEIDYRTVEHESALDRARAFITKPEHHIFQVLIHLHKYQDPKAKHDEIVAHLNSKIVKLWRHRDGQAFQDDASADADFIFMDYQELYITRTDYADGLRLIFKSISVIDHSDFGDNFTFARALTSGESNAWYLDPTSGLLVVAPNTTTSRRLVKGRFKGTAIVIEGAATNLIDAPSGPFNSGNWIASGGSFIVNNLETLDPKGTNTADRWLTAGANGTIHFNSGTPIGNDAASSFWLKCSSGTVAAVLTIEGTGAGASSDKNITITTEWQEFKTAADTSSFTTNLRTRLKITPATTVIYIWGVGLYDSHTWPPTIVDPIATASVTRATEQILHPSENIINRDKGTISIWVKPYWVRGTQATKVFFNSGASTTNRHVSLAMIGTSRLQYRVSTLNGTGLGIDEIPVVGIFAQDVQTHVVFTYDGTISNGGKLYLDGTLIDTSTNDPFSVSEVGTNFAIGSLLNGVSPFEGEINELFIDDRVWPAEEVLAVFNLPNGLPRTLI